MPVLDFCFRSFRSEATYAPAACRQGLLNAKILDFGVKAGIGLLNNPQKHRTGKACTLVKEQLTLLSFN
jgi:hypothetical protein